MGFMREVPKRRWFRFSLRTLFIAVTVCGVLLGWLGCNLGRVRERERLIQVLLEYPRSRRPDRRTVWLHNPMGIEPPWLWRLMGATNEYGNILLDVDMSDKELDDIRSLLPIMRLTVTPHPRFPARKAWYHSPQNQPTSPAPQL